MCHLHFRSTNPAARLRAWNASGELGTAIATSSALGSRGHTASGGVGEAVFTDSAPENTAGASGEQNANSAGIDAKTGRKAATKTAARPGAQLPGMCSLAVLEHVEISVPTPVECAERSLDSTHFLLVGLEVLVSVWPLFGF